MKKIIGGVVLVLVAGILTGGCFFHRHKSYTFDEKFEYHTKKVMKQIKKVVSDEEKVKQIEKKIRSRKAELKVTSEKVRLGKNELRTLIVRAKDKEKIKTRMKELAGEKMNKYDLLIDIIFEVKGELSEEEWQSVAEKLNTKCSPWWR